MQRREGLNEWMLDVYTCLLVFGVNGLFPRDVLRNFFWERRGNLTPP